LPDLRLEALEVRSLGRFFENDVMVAMQKPVFAALKPDGARNDEAMAEGRRALDLACVHPSCRRSGAVPAVFPLGAPDRN